MVTPFSKSGELDWAGVEKIAAQLVSTGHDGIVLNGTTGEAPTTSDDEKDQIIKAVRKVVGDKIKIVAGAGNNETSHSVELKLDKRLMIGTFTATPSSLPSNMTD